jgi:protein O-GlcNAc transferase
MHASLNVSDNRPIPGKFGELLPPIKPTDRRPFWSVIVPIYERTKYLPQSLGSILSQAGGPDDLEILVQDDCSSRDFNELVAGICGGRATYRRNPSRRGLYGNVNDALARVSGQWIHILHEDDFVEPGFYDTFRRALERQRAEVGMACCHYTNLHEADGTRWSPPPFREGAGLLSNWMDRLAVQNPLNVPAVVYRRSVFETLGLFREDMPYTADWEFYVRSAVWFKWWYQPENMARFRVHSENHTGTLASQGRTAIDLRQTIEFIETYLPEEVKQRALPVARQLHGRNFLVSAWNSFQSGNSDLGLLLMRECLRLGGSPPESTEFAQVLQHAGAAALRGELTARWRAGDAPSR